MARHPSTTAGRERRAGILPLRGSERYAPSSAALHAAAEGLPRPLVRVVEAVVFWVAEKSRSAAGGATAWWTEPISFDGAVCADETGHSIQEVLQARREALDLGLLVGEGSVQISADLVAELPALADVDWPSVRGALGGGGTLPACLAAVRELARRSGRPQDPDWISLSREELASAISWGQTRVTQALRDLEDAALLERASGNGLCVRLTPAVWGAESTESAQPRPVRPSASAAATTPTAAPQSDTGVVLRIGGAELRLPPGQKYRLSFADDGAPVIEIE